MLKIPFGQTVTYAKIAKAIAKLKNLDKMSSQAVGGRLVGIQYVLLFPVIGLLVQMVP